MSKRFIKSHPTIVMLAAACKAQRINAGYYSSTNYVSANDPNPNVKETNVNLMFKYLEDTNELTQEDYDMAEKVKAFYAGKIFKMLGGGYINDFDKKVISLLEEEDINSNHVGIIASLPRSYKVGSERDQVEQRIKFANGGYIGKVDDKVTLDVEVLRSVYSHNYNVYFVTVITDSDQVVFFSHKVGLTPKTKIQIKGTVKRHVDNSTTQLNRVKITKE